MDNELKNIVLDAFSGKVVRKDLAFIVKSNLPVPTYVLEYLLGQYCATDNEDDIQAGLEKVKSIIQNNYVNRADAESVKGKIKQAGSFTVIDKINCLLNDKADQFEAYFANMALQRIPIGSDVVERNPKLLSGNGVWCIVKINYITGDDINMRWEINSLKPIQISNVDVRDYIEQRNKFSTEQWLDMLIHTVGLNPDRLNRREKFIVLARLLPHVENNFNFVELGPKGTGKSHVFEELSPYGVLVSGGDVTSARLFSKISGNKEIMGLVGYWDVVAWDEFEQQKGRNTDAVLIDTMQNYLANKAFNRGKATHEASASMAFVGNTKHTVPFMLKNSHLFESIPTSFIKGAFLDRIHLYNPGWEVKILKKDSFSKGYGLITDYIAAVLHELRGIDFAAKMNDYVQFSGTLSQRDIDGIRKTFSGFVKLLYPDGVFTDQEALEIIDFAAESRRRVKDQLYIVDETFKAEPAKFVYTINATGQKKQVATLECLENNIEEPDFGDEPDNQPATDTQGADQPDEQLPFDTSGSAPAHDAPRHKRQRIARLANKTVDLRLNQKGVSYGSLFGDYLRTATEIKVIDPFIRMNYQIENFVDFIQTCRQYCANTEGLKIHLSTNNDDDERIAEIIDTFNDLVDDLAALGIEFTYDFKADHDRSIELNNGWRIVLGRGLDIFEKYNLLSLAHSRQEDRRCKECSITFIESNQPS